MNKKAQLGIVKETASGFAAMFAFILVAIIISTLLINFNTNATQFEEFNTTAITPTMNKMLDYPVYVDWGALLLFGFTWLASLFILSRLDEEPILYIVSWVGIIALSIAIIAAGYALEQIVTSSLLSDAVSLMFFIPFYASNAFMFALVYFFTCAIALHYPKQ